MTGTGLLAGRSALVTGAASGIGYAIAETFVENGAKVVVLDRTRQAADAASRSIGAHAAVAADVANETQVIEAVRQAESVVRGIDILVNCAGIVTHSPLTSMSLELWQETIDIDLTGVFLMCRYTVPGMVDRGSGRVINISSQLAIKGGVSITHYSAAKAGVIGFTKSLAHEVAPHGVLVNAIAPGPISTPLVDALDLEWTHQKLSELPLGRFGTPEEVAPTALLLASSPGGNIYVGQTLGPNSGDVMP